MLTPGFGKSLKGALNDALTANVNPRSRRHLAIHRQTLFIELVKVVPVGPMRHEIGVRDQHARRIGMGLDDCDWLARLHDQCFVSFQLLERIDDDVEIAPSPRSAPNSTVNY